MSKPEKGDIALWVKTLALSAPVVWMGFGSSMLTVALLVWLSAVTSPWVAEYSNLQ